jgi:hypothetical protein
VLPRFKQKNIRQALTAHPGLDEQKAGWGSCNPITAIRTRQAGGTRASQANFIA